MRLKNYYKYLIAVLFSMLIAIYLSPYFQNFMFHNFESGEALIDDLAVSVSEGWYPVAKDHELHSVLFNKVKCDGYDKCILEVRKLNKDDSLNRLVIDIVPKDLEWGEAYLVNKVKKSYGILNVYYVEKYKIGITVSSNQYLSDVISIRRI